VKVADTSKVTSPSNEVKDMTRCPKNRQPSDLYNQACYNVPKKTFFYLE